MWASSKDVAGHAWDGMGTLATGRVLDKKIPWMFSWCDVEVCSSASLRELIEYLATTRSQRDAS